MIIAAKQVRRGQVAVDAFGFFTPSRPDPKTAITPVPRHLGDVSI